jgi:hypothetical protein
MNIIKNKKFIATTLTFVLVMALAGLPLPAKERRGSTVEATMTDGSQVKGELLAVKTETLLIYDRDVLQGKSIDLQQVAQVKVLKKSKFFDGLGIGIVIGLVISVNNIKRIDRESLMPIFEIVGSFWPVPIAGFSGGLIGAVCGINQKFSLVEVSSKSVQQNLVRLKRYAREKDV